MRTVKPPKDHWYALKPCPFCGAEAVMQESTNEIDDHVWRVKCEKCTASMEWETEPSYPVNEWNARHAS